MRALSIALLLLAAGCAEALPELDPEVPTLWQRLAAAGPGEVVSIPRGLYRFASAELDVAEGVTVEGNGSTWIGAGLVVIRSADGLTLRDLVFEQTTLRFQHSAELTLERVQMTESGATDDDDQLRLSYVDGARLVDCSFLRPRSPGRSLQLYRSHDVRVERSEWRGRFRTAINVFGSGGAPEFPRALRNTGITIVDNVIERDAGSFAEDHGIYAWGMSGLAIRGNVVRGWSLSASGGAVKVRNGDGVQIVDNRFDGSGVLLYTYAVDGAPPWLRDVTVERNEIDLRGARPGLRGRLWERRSGIAYWRNFRSSEPVESGIRIVDNRVRDGGISVLGVTEAGAFEVRDNRLDQ